MSVADLTIDNATVTDIERIMSPPVARILVIGSTANIVTVNTVTPGTDDVASLKVQIETSLAIISAVLVNDNTMSLLFNHMTDLYAIQKIVIVNEVFLNHEHNPGMWERSETVQLCEDVEEKF